MRRHVRALFAIAALGSLFAFAGSAAAAECPNEAIRIAQGATRLPDCRAYERVSPADSSGGVAGVDTQNRLMFGAIRADGDAATFGSSGALGDPERGAPLASNLARRTAAGWTSFSTLTTTEPSVPLDLALVPAGPLPSSDMTREMFSSNRPLGLPNTVMGGSIYLSAPEGKGPPTWLSRSTLEGPQPSPPSMQQLPLGGTPDFSSGYFRYPTPLTSIAGDDLRTNNFGLYFFAGSTISPAGVLPSGSVDPSGALPVGTGQSSFGALGGQTRNQVSADGSKLFFVTPAEGTEPKQLYVQEGGAPGRLISHDILGNAATSGIAALNGNPSEGAVDGFAYPTPDGSRVVFRSESALTGDAPESGVKTYRAEITPGAITLTYLPEVEGTVLTIDNDASTILFQTAGSAPGETSYYVWDESPGAPSAIATDLTSSGGPVMLEPVFSESGDVLVFASGAEVEPGVAPLAEQHYTQIYRWTKQSGSTACISCLSGGGTPAQFGSQMNHLNGLFTDNPAIPGGATFEAFNQSSVLANRKISSDGSRVFFDTSDPLDPARDVNNTRDVYLWENGKVHLLTSGRNPVPSQIIDSSTSGNDVMLVTKDGLIPADTNQTYDVYDVRVDGGFAEPVSERCEGDACQGQGSGPRQAAVPGSSLVAGAGNQHQSRKGKARSRKALATAQLGRPGASTARVRIRVPAAGRVSITGADVKNKARKVKPGAVVIAVGLSQTGKHKLARKGRLKTTVKVTFRPQSGAVTKKSMTLSFAGPKGSR